MPASIWNKTSDASIVGTVGGTANQVIVTDAGGGSVVLSTPQDLDTGADVTFGTLAVGTYERHVQIPATLSGTVANQPTPTNVGPVAGFEFAASGTKNLFGQWEVPNDWKSDTDIVVEVDWFSNAVITPPAAIRWILEYRFVAEGEMLTTLSTVTADNGAGGDATGYAQYVVKHSRFTLPYNNATQPATKQDHLFFRLYRDSAVANDFSGTVVVTEFEIVYQSVGLPTT